MSNVRSLLCFFGVNLFLLPSYSMAASYFNLIDSNTNSIVGANLLNDQQVVLGDLKAFNFEAEFESLNYDSIHYSTSTGYEHTERYEPRPACGDSGAGFRDCSELSGFDSDFLLTAQPYLGNSPVGEAITIIVYKQYPQVDGYFELLDPETGGVIQTGIVDKQQIELGSGKAFNFEAEFENIQYDSIRYSTSTGFEHTERYEPRPACGDSGSGFNDCSSLPGFESEFVLTAQPFFGTSAAGAPISITVYASEPLAKGYFDLVDSESGTVVRSGILSDQVVQLDNVDSFNLEAEFGDLEYDSIRYETSTGYTHTERYEPRPVCGNSGSTYNNCADLEGFKADFVLTAQAYSGELPVSELVTINVLVPDASSGSSATGYFDLIDTSTNTVKMSNLSHNGYIELSDTAAFNFEAKFVDIEFDSIQYTSSTGYKHTERYEPRPACGDNSNGYVNCANLSGFESEFVLTAQAYLGNEAVSEPIKLSVAIVRDDSNGGGDDTSGVGGNTGGAPVIQSVSGSQMVTEGADVVFEVQASGSNLTYAWYKGGVQLSGASQAQLLLQNVSTADAGSYFCVVSNLNGNVTSQTVALSVLEVARTASITVSWDRPVLRSDGSELRESEITGYRVHYGLEQDSGYANLIEVNGNTVQVDIEDLSLGTYKFAITTLDGSDQESALSRDVVVVLD